MDLATPFDLLALFPERRSLAIVGNAPTVTTRKIGAEIDAFDTVVRFNESAVQGYEAFVGSRTDILVANPYPERKVRPLADGARPKLVIIVNPLTRRGDKLAFDTWVKDNRVLFTYSPDLVGVADSGHQAGLTTGTYGVQLLTRLLLPSKVLITGFTMFAEAERSHYWHEGVEPGVSKHDLGTEGRIFVNLINSLRTDVEVTEDVAGIAERFGVAFGKNVRVRPA
jgi:hypothetical protein